MRRALALALALPALWLPLAGCSEQEDPPPAVPPTWSSLYCSCRVTAVTEDPARGRVYAATESDGLRVRSGGAWTHYLRDNSGILSNSLRALAVDPSGTLWIATDRGIALFDGAGFTALTSAGTGGGLPSDDVRCLFTDAAGSVWAGTAAGAVRTDGTTWYQGFAQSDGMAADLVTCIGQETTGGAMWFGHNGQGLTRWNGSAFAVYDTTDGLSGNVVNGIEFDSTNLGWFATSNGLTSFDGSTWTIFRVATSGLPNNSVRGIDADPTDVLWIATGGGVARYDHGSWLTYGSGVGLYSDSTRCVKDSTSPSVWVGTDLGLNWLEAAGWNGHFMGNAPLSSNAVRDVHADPFGRMWYATDYGVTRVDGATWEAWASHNSPISSSACTSVEVTADGRAWIGTILGGLNRFDASGWAQFTTSNSGIAGNIVSDVAQDPSGNLWLSTWSGVSRFDGVATFTNWTAADGLGNNIVNCMAVDGAGVVWAGTLGGLSRFDGSASWTNLTTATGLPSNVINDIAFTGAEIWVATALGAAVSGNGGTSWTSFTVGSGSLPGNDTRAVIPTAGGDVFVATTQGLAVRVGGTWTARSTWNSGLLNDTVVSMAFAHDGKALHLGTGGAGISVYRPEHLNTP